MRIVQRVFLFLSLSWLVIPLPAQDSGNPKTLKATANENSARLRLQKVTSEFSVELSANSLTPQPATLRVKIVNPADVVITENSTPIQLSSTPQRSEITVNWIPTRGLEDASHVRLFYEVLLPDTSTPAVHGILSPYRLISGLFELHFVGLDAVGMGRTYAAHVWATHPDSNTPVSGVDLTGTLGSPYGDGSKDLEAHAKTNARGEALLTFHLPEAVGAPDDEEVQLEVKGMLGNFLNSVDASLHLWGRAAILLSTDKPIYQPEQTLHMRVLLLDDQRRAWAKQPVQFVVRDPDDTIIFSSDKESSRFGIADVDWPIPSSQKLGDYRVTVNTSPGTDAHEVQGDQLVRISRYELPTFTVKVRPDQPFYLPGQNADLVVSAAYMFGKPVLRGHVRILRETSRKWNYHDQKWDTEENVAAEGDLDAKSEFHTTLDLSRDHADLQDNDWKRFDDIRFVAYLTDESSKRSQEHRFDLRLSRDAIHLYVLNASGSISSGLPPIFYVSSSLADGTPIDAAVNLKLFTKDPSDTSTNELVLPFVTIAVRTNRYGIARVRFPSTPKPEKKSDRIFLVLEAKTLDGRTGEHVESYSLYDEPSLRVTPSKPILKPGDAITANVESSKSNDRIHVEAIRSETQTVIASQEVKISHGSATVTFAADKQFMGPIFLAAYSLDPDVQPYETSPRMASATVLFPQPSNLQLEVKPAKQEYRPGEAASVNLRVRAVEGEPAEGALGLLVYDQALEDLARTEASVATADYRTIDPTLGFRDFPYEGERVAGISMKDLLNRDPSTPVPSDLELLAQVLLSLGSRPPLKLESSDFPTNFSSVFRNQIQTSLEPAIQPLQDHFTDTGHYPAGDAEYTALLKRTGLDSSNVTDPWGRPYRVQRSYRWTNEVLEFLSDGPDKVPNTADDFTAYSLQRPFFEHDAGRLRGILDDYHASTGAYIRDLATLEKACAQHNVSLSSFVDPWGTPYRYEFGVNLDNFTIAVSSAGPDRVFGSPDYDDLRVYIFNSRYFQDASKQIYEALLEETKSSGHYPDNEQEFRKALSRHGFDWDSLRDPWGRPYRIVNYQEASYSDKITVRAYGQSVSTSAKPVTRTVKGFQIFSDGPDLKSGTPDDFVVARFVAPFSEETGGANPSTESSKPLTVYAGSSGAMHIMVTDPSGAAIGEAKVKLTNVLTGEEITGISNEQGMCLIKNIPAGSYNVLVESLGFNAYVLTNVPVLSSNLTNLAVALNVGSTSETIEVMAAPAQTMTSVATTASGVVLTTKSGAAAGHINIPLATPHLREYFPETLLWQPEVLTDRAGHATVKVPLADSITTWKVSVIASTLDGHIGTATADLRAFQPFFAELDPPKVLTVGDEIHLPITIRNYLDKPQNVTLDWASEPWSQTLSRNTAELKVPAGDYSQKSFSFLAALPMKDAKQRVSAYNRSSEKESDAIEKKLRIHADGQEQLAQANSVFSGDTSLELNLPSSTLPGSVEAELVLYPNLMAHVAMAIEGIMKRPYGCAEQTISSAYPSLLWLQLQKTQQLPESPLDARAKRYLELAYTKLLGYREPGGGISYWGKGDPYVPLTAYALRFLVDASEFVDVDPEVISSIRRWLLQQVSPQGAWMGKYATGTQMDQWIARYYTSYIVQVLARDLQHRDPKATDIEAERQAIHKGLDYLSTSSFDSDPYSYALFALAKLAMKDDASPEIAKLLELQHAEDNTVYWDAQHNTLFYGWGHAGRLETTALVLNVLGTAEQQGNYSPEIQNALKSGTLFLLRSKDRYGVWYTTQATVDVLQALVVQLGGNSKTQEHTNTPYQILVDGKPGPELSPSTDARELTPEHVDLSSLLGPGHHRIEIHTGSSTTASAYLNASYYLPWKDPAVVGKSVRSGDSESLRYSVQFDRNNVATGDPIRCTVRAERVGFRGYGMMLAEVGLPPGADVDRASLDDALSTWDVQSYEIQPDRVVLYLWPRAGGTTFSFTLKPRFPMTAQSAESLLYDYYNPQARASVPPVRFVVNDSEGLTAQK
jgi:hypothetical protein